MNHTTNTEKPGDPAPSGYLAWHAWAEAQHKAGLRQKTCVRCARWKFQQEMSADRVCYVCAPLPKLEE